MSEQGRAHPSDERFIAGDPLRGLAVLAVFVFHAAFGAALVTGAQPGFHGDTAADLRGAFGSADVFFESLAICVYVFFGLSGYLLSRRFVKALLDGTRLPSARNFLRNRVLRIVPAFWLVAGLSLARYGTAGSDLLEVLAIPAFVQLYVGGPVTVFIEHGWTVNTEWVFYLGLPLAAVALVHALAGTQGRRRRTLVLLAAAAAVAILSLLARAIGPQSTAFQRMMPAAAWAFVPGIVLATLEPSWAPRVRGAAWSGRVAALLGLGAVALIVGIPAQPAESSLLRALMALAAITLVLGGPLLLQWSHSRCWRLLDNRPLRWLGERSYSFYLLHFLVMLEVLRHVSASSPRALLLLVAPPAFALTCALSALSYRYVERPFLDRKRGAARPTTPVTDLDGIHPVRMAAGVAQESRAGSSTR